MKSSLVTVTPDMAKRWLESTNYANRMLREKHVRHLAEEIRLDRWMVTHQGLAFSESGRLLDGQHRLAAIVEANRAVKIMITEDLPEDTFRVVDTGRFRTPADRLQLLEEDWKNRHLCSALSCFIRETVMGSSTAMSVITMEEQFNRFPKSWQWAVDQCCTGRVGNKFLRACVIAALAVYHHVNRAKAAEFAAAFITGAGLSDGSSILRLRNQFLQVGARGMDYWKIQGAMRAHMQDSQSRNTTVPSEDLMGNSNSRVLIGKRTRIARAAGRTARAANAEEVLI